MHYLINTCVSRNSEIRGKPSSLVCWQWLWVRGMGIAMSWWDIWKIQHLWSEWYCAISGCINEMLRIFEYSSYIINIFFYSFIWTILPNLFIHFIWHYVDHWHLIFLPEAETIILSSSCDIHQHERQGEMPRGQVLNTVSWQVPTCFFFFALWYPSIGNMWQH